MPSSYQPSSPDLSELDRRARRIFKTIATSYLETGDPVASRTIAKDAELNLSSASIRNVMADLTDLGLLEAPHISAGRQPTVAGLRLFVESLLEIDDLSANQRSKIDRDLAVQEPDELLDSVSRMLSAVACGAGLVLAPEKEEPLINHVEFISLNKQQSIIVIVDENGDVENRVISHSAPFPASQLSRISNFLNSMAQGKTLSELGTYLRNEITSSEKELDEAAQTLIEAGIAAWSGSSRHQSSERQLIVHGRANLLDNLEEIEQLGHVRRLIDDLDQKKQLAQLLQLTQNAKGVRIFIGAENPLFNHSGSSVIIAPYKNSQKKIIGAIGVIGPTRINYAKVIPLVNYTAELIGRGFENQPTLP